MRITYDDFDKLSDMSDHIHKMGTYASFKVINVETRGLSYRLWFFI